MLNWLMHLWNVSSFDHRARVAEILVTGLSIVTGAWVAARQLTKGQEHEVRIKIHEQRRANYDFFFTMLVDKMLVHQKSVTGSITLPDGQGYASKSPRQIYASTQARSMTVN
jgi:hypothetical protein